MSVQRALCFCSRVREPSGSTNYARVVETSERPAAPARSAGVWGASEERRPAGSSIARAPHVRPSDSRTPASESRTRALAELPKTLPTVLAISVHSPEATTTKGDAMKTMIGMILLAIGLTTTVTSAVNAVGTITVGHDATSDEQGQGHV